MCLQAGPSGDPSRSQSRCLLGSSVSPGTLEGMRNIIRLMKMATVPSDAKLWKG